jgi:hypothetical protein
MTDFIQGEKFIRLANGKDIFYCHTHDVVNFLKGMKNHFPYVLITHNSDNCVDFNAPDNVIRWYAQNVNIIDPKIESLPIGLENVKWLRRDPKLKKMEEKLLQPRKYRNIMYVNHTIAHNPEHRAKSYQIFKDKSWATIQYGHNGKGFDEYLDNLYNHNFTISPEGNGIDCPRTWECLYMGTIPIEKRNINNQFYIDLPICFVDDWDEVTEDFLVSEYVRIKTGKWNMEKLTFEYWKNKIVSHL